MKSWIAITLCFAAALSSLTAAENGGLFVDVQKVSLERHDTPHPGLTTIDRTMALRINISNNAMKDMPETTLKYVILIQRWGMEVGRIERVEGELKLEPLAHMRTVQVSAGEVHIGGHLHGTGTQHVDKMAAWKITIERDGKSLEFLSNSTFDALNRQADRKR